MLVSRPCGKFPTRNAYDTSIIGVFSMAEAKEMELHETKQIISGLNKLFLKR